VAEVVGAAGAGKTTLLRALSERDAAIQAIFGFRRIEYVPYFAYHAVVLLPFSVRMFLGGARLSGQDIRTMVHLEATLDAVQASQPATLTMLDQGPVYMLTRLRGLCAKHTGSRALGIWWSDLLRRWAATLDLIIWLDAPDPILLERIRARDKWHSVKHASDQEAYRFLMNFRIAYEQVVSKMTSRDGPRVMRFDTSQEPLQQIVDGVLAAFDRRGGEDPASAAARQQNLSNTVGTREH